MPSNALPVTSWEYEQGGVRSVLSRDWDSVDCVSTTTSSESRSAEKTDVCVIV